MPKIYHRYPWYTRYANTLLYYSGVGFSLFLFFYPFYLLFFRNQPITFNLVVAFLFYAILLWGCILLRVYFHPEITTDAAGLHTKFLWFDLDIPWRDIIEVRPLFNLRFIKTEQVIRTRSLTPFHRLYGLLYSFSLHPCLIVSTGISDFDELIRRIRDAIRENPKSY